MPAPTVMPVPYSTNNTKPSRRRSGTAPSIERSFAIGYSRLWLRYYLPRGSIRISVLSPNTK